jgi:hypothetical protein
MSCRLLAVPLALLVSASASAAPAPMRVGPFEAEVRTVFSAGKGLPSDDVRAVAAFGARAFAGTGQGLARFASGHWAAVPATSGKPIDLLAFRGEDVLFTSEGELYGLASDRASRIATLPAASARGMAAGRSVLLATDEGLFELLASGFASVRPLEALLGHDRRVRQVAVARDGRVAVAAASGVFLRDGPGGWRALFPFDGRRSWAPRDVRGVAFDTEDRLWFASPQGIGALEGGRWRLFTGQEGLPYDDFTCLVAGEKGVAWFGTRIGAIRFDGESWEYRQGPRWLPDDDVRGIALGDGGAAWFATARGVGLIERRPMTLADKARFFEDEIDKRHRRTAYGYVLGVDLAGPGDTSKWVQRDSDNDGLWTSMYGAGECFAYAATKSEAARTRARAAFEALAFLGAVTQGGEHPAPPGFVARTVLPISAPDPNLEDSPARDEQRRATNDSLWKMIAPRWPRSADGRWYWKSDTSSDELDGHFFFYALYHDLVAETPEEKARVRRHVSALGGHLLDHDFRLVDHDGKPTRWGVFDPRSLNHGRSWWEERGLNSLSILSYLKVAAHVTGEARFAEAARRLVADHAFAANTMIPKTNAGPGSGNQSDDEMAFMCYLNLARYEVDPELRQRYLLGLRSRWIMEAPELNPLFNFIAAASCEGGAYEDAFGRRDLSLTGAWLHEAVETLVRFPLDRVDWPLRNGHRIDVVPLPEFAREDGAKGRGHRRNGKVLPIDERFVGHWNHDPWQLDQGGKGLHLADGAAFLLPYYMGLYHGFIVE